MRTETIFKESSIELTGKVVLQSVFVHFDFLRLSFVTLGDVLLPQAQSNNIPSAGISKGRIHFTCK